MSFYTTQQQILSGELSTDQILEILQKPITNNDFGDILVASYEAQIPFETHIDCLDIVGTGGDGLDTFNISTIASLLCASLRIAVAKHGNRSASGVCGSADFVELLGYPLNLNYHQSHQLLVETNFCFLFAPQYNPAFRFAREARSQFGCPSYFNLLGPLLNPAKPKFVSLGISSKISDTLPYSFDFVANILKSTTTSYAIVQADNGMDEVSVQGNSKVILNGTNTDLVISQDFKVSDLKVKNKQDCIKVLFNILDSKMVDSRVEAVLINAALAMQVVNNRSFESNYQLAKEQILSVKFKRYILFLLGKIKEITRVQGSILSQIVENKKLEVDSLEFAVNGNRILKQVQDDNSLGLISDKEIPNNFSTNQFQIICEIKPKSPSAGVLRKELDLPQILAQFEDFGATGISVLTDHKYFGGSVDLFQQVRGLTSKPLLQKDFIISTAQITHAKNLGANMILLIVKILQRTEIIEFLESAQKLDLQVLLEINNVLEYNLIKDLLPNFSNIIIGVNNRNLETLETNLQVSLELASVITHTKWSLSGIKSQVDIDMLRTAG